MPKYTLYYFNAKGRAEIVRLVLSAAGQEYDDIRYGDEWPAEKPNMPFGQMPVLEIDGEKCTQAAALARYLAHEYGLAGSTSLETYKMDEVAEMIRDLFEDLMKVLFPRASDKRSKEERTKDFEERLPVYLCNLQKVLCRNNDGAGFFVGDKLSYADLFLFSTLENLPSEAPLNAFPKIKALKDRVVAIPKVAEYLKTRPAC